jgi:hypothetical protein
MLQEIEMTTDEKLDMYMKSSKKELCMMLIEANKQLRISYMRLNVDKYN